MRYALGLALLLLPATAFAQMFEGPSGTIPVARCAPAATGNTCSRIVDGAGLTASQDYVRVDRSVFAAPSRFADVETKASHLAR